MTPLLDRKLVFVTGKGGTGKTTVASALALLAASQGKKVLICEVDAKGELAGYYEAPPTAFKEKEVQPGLFAMTMDTEASLREYLKLQLHIPIVGRIGPVAKAFDFLATAAPGVREILTVGKLCFEVRDGGWDMVVVDAPATGHIVGQLAAPQAVNGLVKVGLIRTQTDWMLEMLSDPAITGLLAVCTPEEMPVTETIELAVRVREETTVQLAGGGGQPGAARAVRTPGGGGLRRADRAGTPGRARRTGRRRRRPGPRGGPPGRHHAPDPVDPPRAPARGHRPDVPLLYLPYLFTRSHGLRTTRQVAGSLGEELGL